MNGEYPYNETGPLMDELKEAAFEYLLLNPGSDFGDWQQGLIEQYTAEVVDALGNNPDEVYSDLADLWESEYLDPKTCIELKFSDWAVVFSNEPSITVYYNLVNARSELHELYGKISMIREC